MTRKSIVILFLAYRQMLNSSTGTAQNKHSLNLCMLQSLSIIIIQQRNCYKRMTILADACINV